ncbi:MAG: hypothetical protein CM1200mP23_0770 [Nitrososphaerota archaeon]|nr:MAG: hypothetical protein CM1200mP23_0770 [Nitrososphaerota archaeon]
MGLNLKSVFALLAPIGGLIVSCGFLSGILQANKSSAVSWRGRKYSVKEFSQNYIKLEFIIMRNSKEYTHWEFDLVNGK